MHLDKQKCELICNDVWYVWDFEIYISVACVKIILFKDLKIYRHTVLIKKKLLTVVMEKFGKWAIALDT